MKHEPGMAYNTKTLNKIFAVLSILLLMSTIAIMLDDFIRPWKAVQIQGMKVRQEKLQKDIAEFDKNIDPKELEAVEKELEAAKKIVASKTEITDRLDNELAKVRGELYAEKLKNGEYNAVVSETAFKWEMAHHKHKPEAPQLKQKLQKYRALFAESNERIKQLNDKEKGFKEEYAVATKEQDEAQSKLDRLVGRKGLMEKALSKTELNPLFFLRNSPMLDYLDPTLKIQQVVLKKVTDDRYFQHVPKVDRCMTCHVNIAEKGYEDQEQPFRTHSNLELMVDRNSPHPMNEFGCTTCHGGEGHRIRDFSGPAHTPQDKEQENMWVEKYAWHAPHKIPQEMFKLGDTEAACIKCHRDVERVPQANKVNKGYELLENYGCYGCHNIQGWEHKQLPGPSLVKLSAKLDKEWVKSWVWDPFEFNKHSRMPSFFQQSNNSKPEHQVKNIAEVNAIAEFLFEKSESYKPFMKYKKGNAERGKELISSVGCIACHQVEGLDELNEQVGSQRGPYLTGTGSKVDADWLVSWLKKPSHYDESTSMPSFRLSDREANDIATYLMGLRNKKFEELKFAKLDTKVRDELLMEYFRAFDTKATAEAKLAKMSDHERTMELGKRSIAKYGCTGCHSVATITEYSKIGPDLSGIGSKPVTQFGFGHEKVEHKRDAWIRAHLENPRRWDIGSSKAFKDLTRMPNFNLNQDEIDHMTLVLLGQVSDYVPLAGIKRLEAEEAVSEKGAKVLNKYNCKGCHKIDGVGGDILAAYEDENEAPPWLVGQGHRVQSDWFHNFLANVHTLRPWLSVRMPSFNFTNEERNLLVNYFQHKDMQHSFEDLPKRVTWEPGEKAAAKALFKELDCASCHTIGFNNDEPAAPNLYLSKRRLRPSWIEKWLANPQSILPYTSMPNFWEDGEAQAEDILGGDPKKQIQALRKYIQEIGYDSLERTK